MLLRHIFGIEPATPAVIGPSGRPNPDAADGRSLFCSLGQGQLHRSRRQFYGLAGARGAGTTPSGEIRVGGMGGWTFRPVVSGAGVTDVFVASLLHRSPVTR